MGEHETVATDGDIRARLLLALNSKDACGLCIIRPQEVQEAADEIIALRASNAIMREASAKYNAEIERLRAENAELQLVKDAAAQRIFEQAREIGNLQGVVRRVNPPPRNSLESGW